MDARLRQGTAGTSGAPPARLLDAALELSSLVGAGLDRDTLVVLLQLLDAGVNPEALASVVKELRREATSYEAAQRQSAVTTGRALPARH
jgi:mitotic-spindle organizing protein 1